MDNKWTHRANNDNWLRSYVMYKLWLIWQGTNLVYQWISFKCKKVFLYDLMHSKAPTTPPSLGSSQLWWGSEPYWGQRGSGSVLPPRPTEPQDPSFHLPPSEALLRPPASWSPCHGIYIRISYNLHFHFLAGSYLRWASLRLYILHSAHIHRSELPWIVRPMFFLSLRRSPRWK